MSQKHTPNHGVTLNDVCEQMDSDEGRKSANRAQKELDRIKRKLDRTDPSSPRYDRLMRKAGRLQKTIEKKR